MKTFTLQPGMTTMGGVFYPTGYMVLMFPTEHDAQDAARRLDEVGLDEEAVCHASPDEFLREVLGATGDEDDDHMPSAGTESDTARRFSQLAREGHHALLVHAPSARQSDYVMEVLHEARISYGQKYRQLVIQDLT
ncbi:MAG: hypothetical protein JWQ76_3327 [Ramlibacter sp.]|nr:hypothetical protein [Ramlibacter sp.]